MAAMLELEEAQAKLLALAPSTSIESVPTSHAQGRYLVSDLHAARTQPSTDLSAMDGYAIGSSKGPWRLIGESRAGTPFEGLIGDGEAVRISTGAAMPQGSDRVLIQENAQADGSTVCLTEDVPSSGKHVRVRGMDFTQGDLVLAAGERIGPVQIALAIAAGHASLSVRRAPHIAVLDSGDELSFDPAACGPSQIPASNGPMLSAMLAQLGCRVSLLGPVPDDREALATALVQAEGADLLVTSGGASVGDHDLIKPALEDWGADLAFWKVAIKPGKPLIVSTRAAQVILGLPGNPVSSFVTAILFLLPLVRKTMGSSNPLPMRIKQTASCEIAAGGSRREFLRGCLDSYGVRPLQLQDSSALAKLSAANCLIDRPALADAVGDGDSVWVYLLENGSIA